MFTENLQCHTLLSGLHVLLAIIPEEHYHGRGVIYNYAHFTSEEMEDQKTEF